MWAFCRYDLGLTDEEFENLTPVRYEALKRRHSARELFFEKLIARLVLVNFLANTKEDNPLRDTVNADSFIRYGEWVKKVANGDNPQEMIDFMKANFNIEQKDIKHG